MYRQILTDVHNTAAWAYSSGMFTPRRPRRPHVNWYHWHLREVNNNADGLTNEARELPVGVTCVFRKQNPLFAKPTYFRGFFDGGLKDQIPTFGWCLEAAHTRGDDDQPDWFTVAELGSKLPFGTTVPQTEAIAAREVLRAAILAFRGAP